MFMGNDVDLTHELKVEEKIVTGIWKVLYGKKGGLIPAKGMYKKNKCKKCEGGEDHGKHLTKEEIIADKISRKVLKNLRGLLN